MTHILVDLTHEGQRPPPKKKIYIHISPTSFICSLNNTYTSNQTIVCQDISVSQNVLDPQQLDLLT